MMKKDNTERSTSNKNSIIALCFIVLMVGIFVFFNFYLNSSTKQTKSPKEIREERIKKGFSAWDGSHYQLEKIIKKAMNDPKSYDHVDTVYLDKGDYLIVTTTFRGKNAFGGVVKNSIMAKADLDGNVIEIIAKNP